jgi:hypothetical protein
MIDPSTHDDWLEETMARNAKLALSRTVQTS